MVYLLIVAQILSFIAYCSSFIVQCSSIVHHNHKHSIICHIYWLIWLNMNYQTPFHLSYGNSIDCHLGTLKSAKPKIMATNNNCKKSKSMSTMRMQNKKDIRPKISCKVKWSETKNKEISKWKTKAKDLRIRSWKSSYRIMQNSV